MLEVGSRFRNEAGAIAGGIVATALVVPAGDRWMIGGAVTMTIIVTVIAHVLSVQARYRVPTTALTVIGFALATLLLALVYAPVVSAVLG